MKIGNLEFKDYAAKKPLMVSEGKFVTAKEVIAQPSLSLGSLFTLGAKEQVDFVLERYKLEPDFKLGVIGTGLLTKDEVINEIKGKTDLGQELVTAELGYCGELISSLASRVVPSWPVIPKPDVPVIPNWKPLRKCIRLKLTNRVLFCENTTDGVTTPFANYRIKHVHPVFTSRGFTVRALTGVNDVRNNFVPEAKKALTVYLSGIGHGNYSLYTGHWGNRILEVGNYDPAEVKGKSIHFLSCQTARTLGPDTIRKGANSYAGYDENFVLVWDDGSTPAVNEFELFAKSDSTYDIMMANGSTAQQAYDATVAAFNAAIAQVPGTVAATLLTLDRNRLRLHGAPTAKIAPYRYVKICFPLTSFEMEDSLAISGELED
jgi:hypothetical protein